MDKFTKLCKGTLYTALVGLPMADLDELTQAVDNSIDDYSLMDLKKARRFYMKALSIIEFSMAENAPTTTVPVGEWIGEVSSVANLSPLAKTVLLELEAAGVLEDRLEYDTYDWDRAYPGFSVEGRRNLQQMVYLWGISDTTMEELILYVKEWNG